MAAQMAAQGQLGQPAPRPAAQPMMPMAPHMGMMPPMGFHGMPPGFLPMYVVGVRVWCCVWCSVCGVYAGSRARFWSIVCVRPPLIGNVACVLRHACCCNVYAGLVVCRLACPRWAYHRTECHPWACHQACHRVCRQQACRQAGRLRVCHRVQHQLVLRRQACPRLRVRLHRQARWQLLLLAQALHRRLLPSLRRQQRRRCLLDLTPSWCTHRQRRSHWRS